MDFGPASISKRKLCAGGFVRPGSVSDDFTRRKLDWIDAIRRDRAMTRLDACVAAELAAFLNRKTGDAWPSHEKIAERLNGSRSGVKKAVRRLERAGYLDVCGRTHTNHYRPRLKKGPSEDRFQRAERVLARPEKGPGEDEKRSRIGPQNPCTNPLINPTGVDGKADEQATALPTGALARPPKREQTEAKRAVREKKCSAAPSARTPSPHADHQRCEREIADVIGWDSFCELPDDTRAELCRLWSEKKIGLEELRAEFPNSALTAAVTPATGIVNGADHAEVAKAAREKRPADCNRTELEVVHAEKARAEKRL
jgi:hypothetical protein